MRGLRRHPTPTELVLPMSHVQHLSVSTKDIPIMSMNFHGCFRQYVDPQNSRGHSPAGLCLKKGSCVPKIEEVLCCCQMFDKKFRSGDRLIVPYRLTSIHPFFKWLRSLTSQTARPARKVGMEKKKRLGEWRISFGNGSNILGPQQDL